MGIRNALPGRFRTRLLQHQVVVSRDRLCLFTPYSIRSTQGGYSQPPPTKQHLLYESFRPKRKILFLRASMSPLWPPAEKAGMVYFMGLLIVLDGSAAIDAVEFSGFGGKLAVGHSLLKCWALQLGTLMPVPWTHSLSALRRLFPEHDQLDGKQFKEAMPTYFVEFKNSAQLLDVSSLRPRSSKRHKLWWETIAKRRLRVANAI